MGHVEKVDRTLPLNQMIFYVRRDADLRRRWRDDFDGLAREFGHYLTPDMQIPLVPITLNCTVPPIPSSERAYHLGHVLREIVTGRWPADIRVAVIATGGLIPRARRAPLPPGGRGVRPLVPGAPGEGGPRAHRARVHSRAHGGCGLGGTAELLAWIAALPFTAGPADVLGYARTLAWRTGTGMVAWPQLT
jgi:hypothetical protein